MQRLRSAGLSRRTFVLRYVADVQAFAICVDCVQEASSSLNCRNRPEADCRRCSTHPMSNESLVARIEFAFSQCRAQKLTARELAETLRGSGRALEAMPYALIKEMESIALDLDIAEWTDEDGFLPDLTVVLEQLEAWLKRVPRAL